jgi:hypothetical protein
MSHPSGPSIPAAWIEAGERGVGRVRSVRAWGGLRSLVIGTAPLHVLVGEFVEKARE